jgi:HK97 family phage major capsid protein
MSPNRLAADQQIRHIERSAAQSAGDPYTFVMASDSTDRMGDIIEIDGIDLAAFRTNPIALWGHDSASPIGTWEAVRKIGGQLVGKLRLAAPGTSSLIDRLQLLIEQRILRAVSIGFRALEFSEIKGSAQYGLRFTKTELLECSLVPVPANAEALRLKGLVSAPIDSTIFRGGSPAPQPRAPVPAPPRPGTRTMPTPISEKITALQARAVAIDDELANIQTAAENDNNREFTDDENTQITSLAEEKEGVVRSINSNVAIERALANRAVPVTNVPAKVEPQVALKEKPGQLIVKMAAAMTLAYHTHKSVDAVIGEFYRDDERVKAGVDWITKTGTQIATTGRPGWAEELVTEGHGAFLADILAVSVFFGLASKGPQLQFGNNGTLVVPRRASQGHLAGAFVGETGVIPVKQDQLTSSVFERYKLAVISTYSKELDQLSAPAIEQIIRDSIKADTTALIDQKLLSALTARPGVRPAGILAGVPGVPSAGNTPANVNTDIKALFAQVPDRTTPVMIMHPDRALGLSLMTTATGDYIFKTTVESGSFFSASLLVSKNVPSATVILVDAADFATGTDTPQFELSDTATLTMANSDNVAPTQAIKADGTLDVPEEVGIGLGIPVVGPAAAGAGAAGYSAVSMFQTWSTALRMVMPISWGLLRPSSVGAITACAW